jgi:hypothetical protein
LVVAPIEPAMCWSSEMPPARPHGSKPDAPLCVLPGRSSVAVSIVPMPRM